MAHSLRTTKRSLIQRLQEEPYRFSFDQAIFLCKMQMPSPNVVTLCGYLYFDLQPYEVVDVQFSDAKATITTNRQNLLGVHSPLPVAYRDLLFTTKRQKKSALEVFLNIFNHRLLSLSHAIEVKRSSALQGRPYAQSLFGVLLGTLTGGNVRSSIFSGHQWAYTRSLPRLKAQLQHFFGRRFEVCQFVGAWRKIDAIDHTILGRSAHTLGVSATLGTRAWDQAHSIRLFYQPETKEEILSFLPHAERWMLLAQYLRTFLRYAHGYQIVLHPLATPTQTRLDGNTPLGHLSWLVSSYDSARTCDPVHVTVC
ncbi:MAG: type VI secretion system baseplate subunit TssG [Holosporales bacterium]|jgi:type VI secretion system ImpH/TssG family protein|nr:type VI secretion system baseplate subunit TssG [Holosporales bacterium]